MGIENRGSGIGEGGAEGGGGGSEGGLDVKWTVRRAKRDGRCGSGWQRDERPLGVRELLKLSSELQRSKHERTQRGKSEFGK